jgi:hypothetical protein
MAIGRDGYPDFADQVAMGKVPGFTSFRKFGMNQDVNGSGTTEDMWELGPVRVLPSAAGVATLTSDDAEDDPDEATPPGTGAHIIRVEGLDANWLEISEDVTMNGTGNAVTTKSFFRINRMYVVKVGAAGSNVGNITATIGGAAQAYIESDQGQTHQTMYTVPANKYLVINYYTVGVGRMGGATDAQLEGQINLWNEARSELEGWRSISDLFLWNGGTHTNIKTSTLALPKTEIRIQITSTSATQAHAIIGGFLVDANYFNAL